MESKSLGPCCLGTHERTKLCRQHMMARLYAACQGHTHTALCWFNALLSVSLHGTLKSGQDPRFFPPFNSEKVQFPTNMYIHCLSFDDFYVGCVRLVSSLCLCFSLGRNLANWPCSSKCTDTSLVFRHDDIIHMLNFQGHVSVLCWNKARVLNTCQAWIFDHSAHLTLYQNSLISFNQMEILTFCLATFYICRF